LKKVILAAINAKYIHSNLAVYSLKKYAGEDKSVDICEYTINHRVEEIIEDLYLQKPDVIAFSCYIWNIEYVKIISREIKKLLADCKIWLGGPETGYDSINLLNELKHVELIMRGEGEKTFKELLNEDAKYSDILGIVFRNNDGEIISTGERECMDMSEIPFVYDDLTNFENRIIYYESSRGCPFSCSYCLSSVDKRLRFRSLSLVKEELKFFLDNNVKQVKFVDRTFNCKKSHSMEIWNFIKENDNGITNFHFEISADLLHEDEIELLNSLRVGLIQLEIGVQSTNMETIHEINRSMNLEKLKDSVDKINSSKNIHQHLDLIAGLPFEDINSFRNSFNDVYAMNPSELQLGFLKVLKGAGIELQKNEYELIYSDFPPYEVFRTKWLSFDEVLILKKVEEMVEIYYNSGQFKYTVKYLINFFTTAFDFYLELGKYYSNNFNKSMKHSRIDRYNILLDFIIFKIKDKKDVELLKELMIFDIYLRENIKSRPDFARDLMIDKKRIREMSERLGVKRPNHMEIFSKNCLYVLLENKADIEIIEKNEEDEVYFVFDYSEREPLFNNGYVRSF